MPEVGSTGPATATPMPATAPPASAKAARTWRLPNSRNSSRSPPWGLGSLVCHRNRPCRSTKAVRFQVPPQSIAIAAS